MTLASYQYDRSFRLYDAAKLLSPVMIFTGWLVTPVCTAGRCVNQKWIYIARAVQYYIHQRKRTVPAHWYLYLVYAVARATSTFSCLYLYPSLIDVVSFFVSAMEHFGGSFRGDKILDGGAF